jgi:limonene 1,2-monooxygenase
MAPVVRTLRHKEIVMGKRVRFGLFMGPYHAPKQSPSVALRQDLALVEHADRLGFDEAWVGEHHSGGFSLISSPEVLIAAAAERTHRIKLATGLLSIAYQHPFLVPTAW